MSQLKLLGQKRFAGVFWTQSIGAFADNFYKQSLIMMVALGALHSDRVPDKSLAALAGALLMLPFVLFSATAGQLADKYDKARLIVGLKLAEMVFSVVGTYAVFTQNLDLCLVVLLFFGFQAAFFGPLKYSILPQLLHREELVTGNAWVEMSTNVFILVGTILANVLVSRGLHDHRMLPVGGVLMVLAVLGFLAARTIPASPPVRGDQAASQSGEAQPLGSQPSVDPSQVRVEWNPITPTFRILKMIAGQRGILNAVLGVSWFWVLGGVLLTMLPFYVTEVLHSSTDVNTMLFALFSVGVAVGSMLCEKLSFGRLELGLVPFGSIGISLSLFALYLLGGPLPKAAQLYEPIPFLSHPGGAAIALCMFLFSVFTGFFIVPLYTFLQERSAPEQRSRVIAGNNVVNSFFLVGALFVYSWMTDVLKVSLPGVFLVLGLANALVAAYIYTLIPEFFLRFAAYLLSHISYRLKVVGAEKVPEEGGLVLVSNHVSLVDWCLVMAAVRRPVHFVMWHTYGEIPVFRFLFRDAGVIPISSARLRPKILEAAFGRIAECLRNGEVVCIFPEGQITRTGQMNEFRNGVERMVRDTPVPVLPLSISGMWGSNFSRVKRSFWRRFVERPLRSRIEIRFGDPVPADQVNAADLQTRVQALRGDDV